MSTDDTTPLEAVEPLEPAEPLGGTTPLPAVARDAAESPTGESPTGESPTSEPLTTASATSESFTDEALAPEPVVTEPVAAPAGPAATTPLGAAAQPVTRPARARLRIGTVVWGLVIAALGVGVLAYATGHTIDTQLALIVLLTVAGLTLLVGSLVGSARGSRR
ncbi:hypothetical protein [Cellulomonas soli]|uniref:Uncharacterized protein n=1 Tax=Cellulomonas soli TaxID=931535 RepID=A0A512P8W5_9CELL|nr:hypothetical protein [Cellulomonas soli]NYI57857.1 hypothetical protein [Cellulomonas soli]GEP67641.1 hypothetical protein CSO01_03560 [Cellulomonas soli]